MRSASYIRFVCGDDGLFEAAYRLSRTDATSAVDRTELDELLRWFESNLGTPDRFVRTTSKGHYRREPVAISWFKDGAGECVRKAWTLVRVLERNGIAVELLRTSHPGYVTYEDEHQIATIPFSDR